MRSNLLFTDLNPTIELVAEIIGIVFLVIFLVCAIVFCVFCFKYYLILEKKKHEFISKLRECNDEHGLSVITEYRHIVVTGKEIFGKKNDN